MTSQKKVLLASSSVVVDVAPSLRVATTPQEASGAFPTDDHVTVVTRSGLLTQEELPRSTFDVVLSLGPLAHHTVAFLGLLSASIVPGGRIMVAIVDSNVPLSSSSHPGTEETGRDGVDQDVDKLKKVMMMAGLVEPEVQAVSNGTSNGMRDEVARVMVAARRPSWDVGAKAAVKRRIQIVSPDIDNGDDEDLVTEEELLRPEDLVRPQVPQGESGEGTCGKAKACENCTCGRAEGQGPQKLTKEMLENPTSGCGSCGLGDAFRCAGCPYRGLPAFEMGKKIELPTDFLAVDLE